MATMANVLALAKTISNVCPDKASFLFFFNEEALRNLPSAGFLIESNIETLYGH